MRRTIVSKFISDLRKAKILSDPEEPATSHIVYLLLKSRTVRILFYLRRATSEGDGFLCKIARIRLNRLYNIVIGPNVLIGDSIMLPHPINIVIGGETIIGNSVTIAQNVTIGGNFKRTREIAGKERKMPIIGDRVWIASGAVVAGPVVIGSDVVIGANSVITRDIPSNSLVYGQNCISEKTITVGDGAYSIVIA